MRMDHSTPNQGITSFRAQSGEGVHLTKARKASCERRGAQWSTVEQTGTNPVVFVPYSSVLGTSTDTQPWYLQVDWDLDAVTLRLLYSAYQLQLHQPMSKHVKAIHIWRYLLSQGNYIYIYRFAAYSVWTKCETYPGPVLGPHQLLLCSLSLSRCFVFYQFTVRSPFALCLEL